MPNEVMEALPDPQPTLAAIVLAQYGVSESSRYGIVSQADQRVVDEIRFVKTNDAPTP
ncbi:MAG: hypothetical protein ABR986_02130 [Methanomassiliicoccales archaeon]